MHPPGVGAESRMARSARPTAPAAVPRQPAWTAARTPASGSTSASGRQSATRMASVTPGDVGHEDVGVGHGVVLGQRATAPVLGPDDGGGGAVDLAGEDQVVERHAEGRRGPGPVLHDGRRVVAHVQAEVERVVGGRRPAAVPRRHGHVGPECGRLVPAQQRDGRGFGHAPRPYRGSDARARRRSVGQEAWLSSHTVVGTTDSSGRPRRGPEAGPLQLGEAVELGRVGARRRAVGRRRGPRRRGRRPAIAPPRGRRRARRATRARTPAPAGAARPRAGPGGSASYRPVRPRRAGWGSSPRVCSERMRRVVVPVAAARSSMVSVSASSGST